MLTRRQRLVLCVHAHALLAIGQPAVRILHELRWHVCPVAHTRRAIHVILLKSKSGQLQYLDTIIFFLWHSIETKEKPLYEPLSWPTESFFSCLTSSCSNPRAQRARFYQASLLPTSFSRAPARWVSVAPLLQVAVGEAPGSSYAVWASGACGKEESAAAPRIWSLCDPCAPFRTSPTTEGPSVWDPQRHPKGRSSAW